MTLFVPYWKYPDQGLLGSHEERTLTHSEKVHHGETAYVMDPGNMFRNTLEPSKEFPANLVRSLCLDGLHRPLLDLDRASTWLEAVEQACHFFPQSRGMVCIPSRSGTKWHAYIPDVTYLDIGELIAHLHRRNDYWLGQRMLEGGWLDASYNQGALRLRLPGVS